LVTNCGNQSSLESRGSQHVTHTVETKTVIQAWQTLEFNFANQVAGTAALNLALYMIKHLSSILE
jgi:hypothetical protein